MGKLYNYLLKVRKSIYRKINNPNLSISSICKDEELLLLNYYKPKSIEDLHSIKGIRPDVKENYGKIFINAIKKYIINQNPLYDIDENFQETLDILSNRLININRNNKLLNLNNIYRNHFFDLIKAVEQEEIKNLLFDNKEISICDLQLKIDNTEEKKKYNKIVSIQRNANRILKEKGQYDIYIGYPFVKGNIINLEFSIFAPLMLFPIILDKTPTSIKIKIDKNKDILFNNVITKIVNNFQDKNSFIEDEIDFRIMKENLSEIIVNYYRKFDITFTNINDILDFTPHNSDINKLVKETVINKLNIIPNVILGNFPVYSSVVQQDFNTIIEQKKLNKVGFELLKNFTNLDYYSESSSPKKNYEEYSEDDISYINSLNYSQEKVLYRLKNEDALVIQGPPGTGKSQTIVNLIANAVNDDKKVLMVSEKKASLEVIYSRLGNLAKYSILLDDSKDKSIFYDQIINMFDYHEKKPEKSLKLLSAKAKTNYFILNQINERMYKINDKKVKPYQLFRIDNKTNWDEDTNVYNTLLSFKKNLFDLLDFETLNSIYVKFNQKEIYIPLIKLFNLWNKNPIYKLLKNNLSYEDYKLFIQGFKNFETNGLGRKRIFSRNKVNEFNNFQRKYFEKKNFLSKKEIHKIFIENQELNFHCYENFANYSIIWNNLNIREQEYFDSLYNFCYKTDTKFNKANKLFYQFWIYLELDEFISKNRSVISNIDNFEKIVNDISKIKLDKRSNSIQHILKRMENEFDNHIVNSNRISEIKRLLLLKNKRSVRKLVNQFQFELLGGIKVWLLTPEVVSEILPLEPGLFDLIVFDEASQIFIEKAIPSIFRGQKVVISGDHKQLRPSNFGLGRFKNESFEFDNFENPAVLEHESLLDLARFRYNEITLNYHYRSKFEELISFSNAAFYKNHLVLSPNRKKNNSPSIQYLHIPNGIWENQTNIPEAQRVVEVLKDVISQKETTDSIGIITFNGKQRDLILDELDKEIDLQSEFGKSIKNEFMYKNINGDTNLFVKNIESVQGDERDIVILSIGYGKNRDGIIKNNFGWLNLKGGENRLNVAITRAKKKMIIVSSIDPSDLHVENTLNDGPKLLKDYLLYSMYISEKDFKKASTLLSSYNKEKKKNYLNFFKSEFENELISRLEQEGFIIDEKIGLNNNQIDFAIKDQIEDKFLLGIQLDHRIYEDLTVTQERDFHNIKFLEYNGWKIYRIWSSKWWKNPENEIKKIRELLSREEF